MDIDALTARELDGAIAARVFGFTVEPRVNGRTRQPDVVQQLPSGDFVQVAYCSSSGSAARTLALKLQDLGWTRKDGLLSGSQWSAAADPRVILEHRDGRVVEATGRTATEAIARAAVKASE